MEYLLLLSLILASTPMSSTLKVQFVPSKLRLDGVSQQFRETMWRRLTSSVPRREYALQNLDLELSSEFLLLLGASSSGKSTILKLICGTLKATQGSVTLGENGTSAVPVYLDQKPPYDNTHTVEFLLDESAGVRKLYRDKDHTDNKVVVKKICSIIGLDDQQLKEYPARLSPSENYKVRLAVAALQSMVLENNCNPGETDSNDGCCLRLVAPILLLDEWVDFETSTVVHRVEESIFNLIRETGATVVCVTHKPQLWKDAGANSITMCRGEILSRCQPTIIGQ